MKFKVPRSRGRLLDSENSFSLQFGVEMKGNLELQESNNGGEGEEEKETWREKEGLLEVSEKKNERGFGFFIKKKGFLFFFIFF